ncbi:cupin domain-containing protein [Haloplanus halophilus]|uniref:cupin domain-containing protein n=1 Tax=Haloplanus halophilus TaxID=2949993 RepID=UPI00203FF8D1|nr:cupin domain-containing protein [Haloplanus sp. GDY1]
MRRISEDASDGEEVASGVYLADLASGERAAMKHWRVDPGARLPVHRHDNEQIGYMIRGTLTAITDDGEVTLRPGDSYLFTSDELHGAENRGDEPAVGIGVLSPPRSEPDWKQS